MQPPGAAAYTVDGWMDMPGQGRLAEGATWDVETEYGGGVAHHDRPGVGGDPRVAGGVRRGPRARRSAAVARGGRAGGRRGPWRVPAEPGVALLPRPRARGRLRLGPGQPRGRPRRGRRDHHRPGGGPRPRGVPRADRRGGPGLHAHRRAGPADRRGRAGPRRAARTRRPRGVPPRRPALADHDRRRLDPGHHPAAVGGWRRAGGDAAAARRPAARTVAGRRRRAPGAGAARGARPPARRARRHRRPGAGRGGVPRAGRRRPPAGARVRLHRTRLGDRRRRRRVLR